MDIVISRIMIAEQKALHRAEMTSDFGDSMRFQVFTSLLHTRAHVYSLSDGDFEGPHPAHDEANVCPKSEAAKRPVEQRICRV